MLRDRGAARPGECGRAGAHLSVPPARGALRRPADVADPRRGLDLPRPSAVRRAHPRMAEDAAKKNVAVVFATQSLADIASSSIAPAIIESCPRSEEHTSELQSLMRISYAVFCLNKKNKKERQPKHI